MENRLQLALAAVEARKAELLAETIRVTEIPAPPFQERERSAYVETRFRVIGLADVQVDALGNVTGIRRGAADGPAVMVVSHMDTVFPAGTDVTVRVEGDLAHAPGVGDNSMAVANLINLPQVLDEAGLELPCTVVVAACVGEEGLGDLRGMRQLMADWKDRLDAVVVYDGNLGWLVHGGVGSRRWKVRFKAEGGHSWGDFGNASAIHGLVTACQRFVQLKPPAAPKTTFNVGTIAGGTSVNAIAETCEVLIDMRSVDGGALDALVREAEAIFMQTASEFRCGIEIEDVGNRPGGQISAQHPLVQVAADALKEMGITPEYAVSSTDANIPLSLGMPAICIGAGTGHNAHTVREYMEISAQAPGLQQLIRVLAKLDWKAIR